MNARLYDPRIGRFFSPDNYITDAENPQSYNRYSYALNNPLSYVDPSGNSAYSPYNEPFDGTACGFGDNVLDIMGGAYSEWAAAASSGSIEDYIYGYSNYLGALAHQNTGNGGGGGNNNPNNDDEADAYSCRTGDVIVEADKPWYVRLWEGVKSAFNSVVNFLKDLGNGLYKIAKTKDAIFTSVILGVGDLILNSNRYAIDAYIHYRSGNTGPMNVDASHLPLAGITQGDLVKDPKSETLYTLSLFKAQNYRFAFTQAGVAFGTISLRKIGEDRFKILDDTYDFDMHDWNNETLRNLATLALWGTNNFPASGSLMWKNAKSQIATGRFGMYGFKVHFYNNYITIPK